MFRPAFVASTLAAATAALALGACSPQDLASAGDSSQAVGMVAMANQTLPDPSEQALAPICAAPDAAVIEQLQSQMNTERESRGKKPVRFKKNLAFAAQAHACDMAQRGFFDHRGSDGSMPKHRIRASGFRACLSAENIALDWRSPAAVVQAWMESPGHAANILRPGVAQIGTAFIPRRGARGPWVVQVFAGGC